MLLFEADRPPLHGRVTPVCDHAPVDEELEDVTLAAQQQPEQLYVAR